MSSTILVVDDSEIVLAVTRTVLEGAGYRVLTQAKAAGSVSLIVSERPALVLLDVNMPALSGDMIARISARTANATGTLVVLHSSLSDDVLQRLVTESGAHAYIRKTDNTYSFLTQVRRLLGEKASGTHVSASRVAANAPPPSSSERRQERNVLLVDRDMTTLATLREIVRELGHRADFALSALQAMDKLRASPRPDVTVIGSDMPDDGLSRLLRCARELDTDLLQCCVILTTPGSSHLVPAGFPGVVLPKPANAAAFRAAVARLLDERPPQLRAQS
ncbi:MAG: response regulator [Myxococcales bacterium]|nr:response regulator [Myxococcales bacterium]